MNPEKLAKLQAHAAQVRIGGKGSARRKKKFVHRSAADDKKVQKEATKAEPDDVKPGPSHPPKKEEPKITELKLPEEFIEKCNVSTSTAPIEIKIETAKIGEVSGDLSDDEGKVIDELRKKKERATTIIVQEGVHFTKKTVKLGEDPGIFGTMPKGMLFFERWNDLIFYTFDGMKNLEAVLNSRTDYVKGHGLRALCTVFFTRVDKELLVKIKNETENEALRKKAEHDSGVTIDNLRHIGLGRTILVHCRTPTGANTIVKNGLLIGGITLRKGKLEEFKPVVQCTHCWKMDHKIGNCPLHHSKDPAICGTCGKSGHRRKECPTPNEPKCVLCEGKHSSSAARCPIRQATINKRKLKSDKKGKSSETNTSQREKLMNALADMVIGNYTP